LGPKCITAGGTDVQITTLGNGYAVTLGWVIALLVLLLTIVFLVVGMPNPQVPLFLIGALALARLL
jgi:hypothetical protein